MSDENSRSKNRWPIYLGVIIAIVVITAIYVVNANKTNDQEESSETSSASTEKKKVNPNAKVVVEEFSDYQCPYCAVAHFVLQDVKQELGDYLEVKFINTPLLSLHPNSKTVSIAAECAAQQDKFNEYQDFLFGKQNYIIQSGDVEARLVDGAAELDLDQEKFKTCFQNKETEKIVDQDMKLGEEKDVQGTPTIYINGQKADFETWEDLADKIKKAATN